MDEDALPTGIKALLTLTCDFLENPEPYLRK
jgi:hypothetical protein